MAAKSKKAKPSLKDVKENRRALLEKANKASPKLVPCEAFDMSSATRVAPAEEPRFSHGNSEVEVLQNVEVSNAGSLVKSEPPPMLTLPLLTDSAALFIQGVQQLTARLLGTPECAPLLVFINATLKSLETAKKLIVGNDDEISGLKKLVIETGQPWGEKGSKQLVLAGVRVPVKAVNYRAPDAPLTINDLDAAKVEAYLRGVQWTQPIEKVLACYMKPVTTWTLKDLPPQQQTNLTKMLADPGEDGQGLRQCLKETKYQMMAAEMEATNG